MASLFDVTTPQVGGFMNNNLPQGYFNPFPATLMNIPGMTPKPAPAANDVYGLLGVDRNNARTMGLLAAASAFLDAGAGGRNPQDASLGRAAGRAALGGMGAYQNALKAGLAEKVAGLQAQKMISDQAKAQRTSQYYNQIRAARPEFGNLPDELLGDVLKEQARQRYSADSFTPITEANASKFNVTSAQLQESAKNGKILLGNNRTGKVESTSIGPSGIRIGDTEAAARLKSREAMRLEEFKTDNQFLKGRRETLVESDRLAPRLEVITNLTRTGRVTTDPVKAFTLPFKQVLRGFGYNVSDTLPDEEVFRAASKFIIPRMREKGSGSTSDAEMTSFAQAAPSFSNTPLGNYMIAQGMLQTNRFLKKELGLQRKYLQKNKSLVGFEDDPDVQKKLGKAFLTIKEGTPPEAAHDLQKRGLIKPGDIFFDGTQYRVYPGLKKVGQSYNPMLNLEGLRQ